MANPGFDNKAHKKKESYETCLLLILSLSYLHLPNIKFTSRLKNLLLIGQESIMTWAFRLNKDWIVDAMEEPAT